jgi:hypothetical protein
VRASERAGRFVAGTFLVELLRTTDLVLLSFVEALLKDAGIDAIVLDTHASVVDGSVMAVPRRVMALEKDAARARATLREAGITLSQPT